MPRGCAAIAVAVVAAGWFAGVCPPGPTAANPPAPAETPAVVRPAAPADSAAETADAREVRFGELVNRGELDAALAAVASLPADAQARGLRAIALRWLRDRPGDARVLAEHTRAFAVADEGESFAAVVNDWAVADSGAVAAYARELPPGAPRAAALEAAWRAGTLQNPAAVAAWLPQLRDAAEFDRAAAYLVAHTDPLFRPTAQAREWAELIRDPALRAEALGAVVREWAARDAAGATDYVVRDGPFSPDERRALLATITPRPDCP